MKKSGIKSFLSNKNKVKQKKNYAKCQKKAEEMSNKQREIGKKIFFYG